MKRYFKITLIVSLCLIGYVKCQEGPAFKANLTVVDHLQQPIPEADVEISLFTFHKPGEGFGSDESRTLNYKTDSKGKLTINERSKIFFEPTYGCRLKKANFYASQAVLLTKPKVVGLKWEPWDHHVTGVMPKVMNPIPLIARFYRGDVVDRETIPRLPAHDKPVGFDLEVSDWVAPYGKGVVGDLVFKASRIVTNFTVPWKSQIVISFSNQLDGIIHVPSSEVPWKSVLRLPHLAPETGYLSNITKRNEQLPENSITSGPLRINEALATDNYFLRIRTKTDPDGKIISANYAKIYGPFDWQPSGTINFKYFYNPNANDRNLEFDPKRNLLRVIPSEVVDEP